LIIAAVGRIVVKTAITWGIALEIRDMSIHKSHIQPSAVPGDKKSLGVSFCTVAVPSPGIHVSKVVEIHDVSNKKLLTGPPDPDSPDITVGRNHPDIDPIRCL
jgi:hypothetical protein